MANLVLVLVLCAALVQLASAGEIYTRWGRKSCPKGSVLLYAGHMAGSHYATKGSGGNYLCMHNNPKVGTGNVLGNQPWSGWIHGIEYEVVPDYGVGKPYSSVNVGGSSLHNSDAPCAVCYNPKASTHHMVPGRPDCPSSDMHLEYNGYIVSEASYTDRQRTEFICLDGEPEAIPGGQADDNQGVIYPVQLGCGSLPCSTYTNGNEVTCAVCSI